MVARRSVLGALAGIPAAAALSSAAAAPQRAARLKTRRAAKIEQLYRTPHGKPNGLDYTSEGLWIIDQGPGNWVSVVEPRSGALIREFQCENVLAASGLCVDEDGVWIGSTYNRLIVLCDPRSGDTLANYPTPGAGLIYHMAGDPPGRRSTVQHAYPPSSEVPRRRKREQPLPGGQLPLHVTEAPAGTGAHSILSRNGMLYVAVPPARQLFVIDKKTWVVQAAWPLPGNRPHGSCWADAGKSALWLSDSNLNAFFLHDVNTGEMLERLQLPDDSPVIHGATLHDGYLYFCDDVGWMFRFRIQDGAAAA